MAVPIIVAVVILIKNQNISRKKAGLIIGNLRLQLILGLSGIAFGIIEFLIIKPTALIPDLNPFIPGSNLINIALASLIIIISTGFLEELIFRGIIQRLAEPIMGNALGIIFTSVLFNILNIGWNSPANVIFIFLVSLYYGYIFQKSGSIFGIGISHGLCNVVLYLMLPFLV
jgi:membrane protease YdiL (CAAX protease family)